MSTPVWDGKPESCPRYLSQIKALAKYYDCRDALDAKEMQNSPTKTEYKALGTTNPNDIAKAKLYMANKKLCAIIMLGQKTDYGLLVISKTKSNDFPQGIAYYVLEMLKSKNKPNDVTAEIELKKELKRVQFRNAKDYYKDIISVTARFDVSVSETELIKIMANEVTSATYTTLIMNHLNAAMADDFEELCNDISKIQCLTKTRNGGGNHECKSKEKEVQITSTDFKGICNFYNEKAGHKCKDCPECKKKMVKVKCTGCGKNGHLEAHCWKSHPDKA